MTTAKQLWFLAGLALLLAACGGGAPPQDLTLSGVSPDSPTVAQGSSLALTLTLASQNGFQGQVSLSVTENGQAPFWLTLSPTSATLNVPKGGTKEVTVQLSVGESAPIGVHNLTLTVSRGDSAVAEEGWTLGVYAAWRGSGIGFSDNIHDVLYSPERGLFIAVLEGGDILVNPDGERENWVSKLSVTADFFGVAEGGSAVVAVGQIGAGGKICTSSDSTLASWSCPIPGTPPLRGVAHGNGRFVAVGDQGTILTSPDGVTWTQQTSGTPNRLNGVTYGNGTFVAVGERGTILTSPDGVNWSLRSSETGSFLWDVAWGNGLFVAVGSSRTVLTSRDGVNWTRQDAGTGGDLFGVTHGAGFFVAVGHPILLSLDGASWVEVPRPTSYALYAVAYGNGRFVAVGSGGVVALSP
jgi:hypothetical protein